jgi:hypothetical protein
MLTEDQDLPNSPPLRALESSWFAPPTSDLPSQPGALIGRDRELSHLRQMLARPEVRLLTLTGAGGTGKTRLAIELAVKERDAFEHGCVFVDLAPVSSAALVPTTLAAAVGLRDIGTQPLLETLKLYLRERHILAVLDNFEHLLDAAPLLPELLAASTRLNIIVTSRAALRLWRWEHEFAVAPLAVPDLASRRSLQHLVALAGLAILPSFQEAVLTGFGGRLRFGATVAFVVAATPFAVAGIPNACWSLLAGLIASHLAERHELKEVKATA